MKKNMNSFKTIKAMQGIIMLEALIAILILSFGILGLVGLQATMIKNSTDAKFRAEAANYANRLIGQLWTDQANLANYAIANNACTSGLSACSSWLNEVTTNIPNGTALVNINGNAVTVTISWNAPGQSEHKHSITATVTN